MYFLNIIRMEFGEKDIHVSEEIVDWNRLSELARAQNLLPLFFEAASGIKEYVASPQYQEDQRDALYMIARQIQRSMSFVGIYQRFLENGVEPIVMKGLVLRHLYGELGEGRPSGDEDILIEVKAYPAVKAILEQEKYICEFPDITERELRQIQAVSFFNIERRLTIEVHTNAIGKENESRIKMNRYFSDAYSRGRVISIYDTPIRVMDPDTSILFLILHAWKHFLNRGVGIRQVLDILVYYKKYESEISRERLKKALKDCGAEAFWNDVLAIGERYLGFETEAQKATCCPEELLMDIMQAGVFGGQEKTDFVAARLNMAMEDGSENGGKLQALFRAVFPAKRQLAAGYPFLEDKPWLLPVVWVRRGFKFLRYAGKDSWKIGEEILQKSSARMELIKKYKR